MNSSHYHICKHHYQPPVERRRCDWKKHNVQQHHRDQSGKDFETTNSNPNISTNCKEKAFFNFIKSETHHRYRTTKTHCSDNFNHLHNISIITNAKTKIDTIYLGQLVGSNNEYKAHPEQKNPVKQNSANRN